MKRVLKFLFATIVLTGVIVSCGGDGDKPGPEKGKLVISASSEEIMNDGEDAVVFTVKYDGEDVTSSAVIKMNGEVFTGTTFTSTETGTFKFKAEYDGVTSNEVTVTVNAPSALMLSTVDGKEEIAADGVDAIMFVVTLHGEDVTSDAVIKINGEVFAGTTFTSTETGTFKFKAEYDGVTSNEITVTVNAPSELILSTVNGKNEIAADGMDAVTFIVTLDSEDVTSSAVIKKDGVAITGHTFSSLEADDYEFTAEYDGLVSEDITVTVRALGAVVLSVNKALIQNDGEDEAIFTVMCGEDDVTSLSTIKMGASDISGTTFSTTEVGIYKFTATYAALTSNEITVTAQPAESGFVTDDEFDATRVLYKTVLYLSHTFDGCIPCVTLKDNLAVMAPSNRVIPVYIYEPQNSAAKVEAASIDVYRNIYTQLRDGSGFSATAYPATMVELDKKFIGAMAVDEMKAGYYDEYVVKPARTGIKVASAINGNKVEFTVSVGAQVADNYYVGALLVEDKVVSPQSTPSGNDTKYVHKGVFRDYATTSVYGNDLGAMSVGDVVSKNLSIGILSKYAAENLSLVVYTLYKDGDNFRIANSVKVPANGSTGYMYVQ